MGDERCPNCGSIARENLTVPISENYNSNAGQDAEVAVSVGSPIHRLLVQVERLVDRVLELSRERAPPDRSPPAQLPGPPPAKTGERPDQGSAFGDFFIGFVEGLFGIEEARRERKRRKRDRKAWKRILKAFWT